MRFNPPPPCEIIREPISDNCSRLDNDPECTLRKEVVDGVKTWDQYRETGNRSNPSGQSLASPGGGCTLFVTRPWWEKNRTYSCYAESRPYDLSDAVERYDSIHESFDSGTGGFSDRRKDAQGNYQEHRETTKLPASDSQSCTKVCKTKKPRPGVSIGVATGGVGSVADSPAWDYSYYECLDILPRLKSGDSYGAHPGINPE